MSRSLITVISIVWLQYAAAAPQLGKDPVADVIAAMTLEEKVGMVIGTGAEFPGLPPERRAPSTQRAAQRVPGAAGSTFAIPRLGIPAIVLADGPAGLRIQPLRESNPGTSYYCTAFPIATLLASTWDADLVEEVGRAMGNEIREYGVDILLAPALNLHRYPLGGRNFEYYSEDPLVSGRMAAAMIRGVQSQGVGATIKHFVANNHEWNRGVINVIVDERAFREIYLKGFEIAIREGSPWAVMSSYNKVNGSYTTESPWLLTTVLRNQWDFSGLVMTDWWGGSDAVAQMRAGNDLLMPGTITQQRSLMAAVREGVLEEAVLDRNIRRILNVVLRTPAFKSYRYSDKPDLKNNAQTARTAATQGMVLLKNARNALPLPAGARIAMFGNSSYEVITGGTGSGDVNEAYSISMKQGLEDAGFTTDRELNEAYTIYIKNEKAEQPPLQRFRTPPPVPEWNVPLGDINRAAAANDVAVITLGRNSGEFTDRKAANDFYLSDAESNLIRHVSRIFHAYNRKVVVVLNIGGSIETASWRDRVDSILLAWQPGQETGHAVADILSGSVNPSGKLADTFPLKLEDFASASNFPGIVLEQGDPNEQSLLAEARAAEIVYEDGIWVGYRHFNSRDIETAYPFGFGLSYTDFEYSDLKLSNEKLIDTMVVSVTITNKGNAAGKEIVQLYLSAPEGPLPKPVIELKNFSKTGLLYPGESRIISFLLTNYDLASFDTGSSSWLVDDGIYTVSIGASSEDLRLSDKFEKLKKSYIDP